MFLTVNITYLILRRGEHVAEKRSRRGLTAYEKNPFYESASRSTKSGTKRISNKAGDKMMIVSDQGEIMAPAGFHEIVEVDKTQFVKLYLNGVKAFQGLSNPGIKVFEIIYREMQNNPGRDTLHLHYAGLDQDLTPISEATFFRGLKELLAKKFIAESFVPTTYFINIDYIFNGNRLAFIKEIRLKESSEHSLARAKHREATIAELEEKTGQISLLEGLDNNKD
jgi:hypothetical protein